jgi:hypothetical protein
MRNALKTNAVHEHEQFAKTSNENHHSPSLLNLSGFHGNDQGGTGISAFNCVFVVRHGEGLGIG